MNSASQIKAISYYVFQSKHMKAQGLQIKIGLGPAQPLL